jgi:cytochrome c oxidase subunit 3
MPMTPWRRKHRLAEHGTALAHQFDDLEQQHEASTLGMWAFLLTEVMFFGGLFIGYTVYRTVYLPGFIEGSQHLDLLIGTLNTAILISSSLTMALAVHAAQEGKHRLLVRFVLLTMVLGLMFLGLKSYEYWHKYHEGLVPGLQFSYVGQYASQVALFLIFYFVMTALHALHMIIGIGLLAVLAVLGRRRYFSTEYYTPVEAVGLYWHFVDIVWIFLYPLLYLVG